MANTTGGGDLRPYRVEEWTSSCVERGESEQD